MNIKKILIPVAVFALAAISAYSMIDTNMKTASQYKKVLDTARDYASQGIVDDAVKYYKKALEYKIDTDTYIEYCQVYVDNGQEKKALKVAQEMVETVDNSEKAYEYLLDRYIALKDYEDCFSLDDEVTKKHIKSDGFAQKIQNIEYTYSTGYNRYEKVQSFSSGYAAICSDELYGIVDETGNSVLNRSYKSAGYFSYYANEENSDDSDYVIPVCTQDGQWQYISSTGSKKIEIDENLKFDTLGLYVDRGLISASTDGKYSYYNTNFEKQFGEYLYAGTFNCGRAAVQTEETKWYIINEKGEQINSEPYLNVITDEKGIAFRNNRAFVLIDGDYRMVDIDGNIIGEQKFIDAFPFLTFQDDENKESALAAVCIDGKWGFVDIDGKVVIEPQFMKARSFSNHFAAVENNGKWGFITSDGALAIDYTFDDVKDFNSKGCVFVSESSGWILIKLYRYNH